MRPFPHGASLASLEASELEVPRRLIQTVEDFLSLPSPRLPPPHNSRGHVSINAALFLLFRAFPSVLLWKGTTFSCPKALRASRLPLFFPKSAFPSGFEVGGRSGFLCEGFLPLPAPHVPCFPGSRLYRSPLCFFPCVPASTKAAFLSPAVLRDSFSCILIRRDRLVTAGSLSPDTLFLFP